MKTQDALYPPAKVLLSSHISKERLQWLQMVLPSQKVQSDSASLVSFFLCGDALYSLTHPETVPIWKELIKESGARIVADYEDLVDMGLIKGVEGSGLAQKGNLNTLFINKENAHISSAGFLHLYSPYMHRHTEKFLTLLDDAVSLSIPVSVILYLDAVHLCHSNQVTTEFENIEQGLDKVQQKSLENGLPFIITACQRCSQARGYMHPGTEEDNAAPCFRNGVWISGLSQLIPLFSSAEIVLHADCINIAGSGNEVYILVVTGTPYGTEHAFGAISFAVALSGKNIPTYVIFAEDGAYCYIPAPDSWFCNTVRDIQSVIMATATPGLLEYGVFECSLSERGIIADNEVPEFQVFRPYDIALLMKKLITGGFNVRTLIW
ncbi:hypothetical protein [Methanospirillum sp.]|uniref:hypothetical protein n=1 Tax=Methanospirillum sp. TaxID=45200 RepID=UPI0035A14F1E